MCKVFRKASISYSLIGTRACAYQEVRKYFSEHFEYVQNEWSQIPVLDRLGDNSALSLLVNYSKMISCRHGFSDVG